MTLPTVITRGRRMAERLMLDTVTVSRPDVSVAPDPLTGQPVLTAIYAGVGKVQTYEAQESTPESGGHVFTQQRYRVDIPVGSCSPAVGDVVSITTATLDANLAGRKYRVVALLHKTAATAYRLGVEEVVA